MSKKRVPQQAFVQEILGELGRYLVGSMSNPLESYMVDLLAHGGKGECNCTDWQINCRMNLQKFNDKRVREYGYPGQPDPERQQCKHIYIAKRKFANDSLYHLSNQRNEQNED